MRVWRPVTSTEDQTASKVPDNVTQSFNVAHEEVAKVVDPMDEPKENAAAPPLVVVPEEYVALPPIADKARVSNVHSPVQPIPGKPVTSLTKGKHSCNLKSNANANSFSILSERSDDCDKENVPFIRIKRVPSRFLKLLIKELKHCPGRRKLTSRMLAALRPDASILECERNI